jgi:hypothetical protein
MNNENNTEQCDPMEKILESLTVVYSELEGLQAESRRRILKAAAVLLEVRL